MRAPELRIVVHQGGPNLWNATVQEENEKGLYCARGQPHVHWENVSGVWQTSRALAIRDADKIIEKRRKERERWAEQEELRWATTEILPR